MPITIGSNIASLNAQRQLGKASESLTFTYERLSSGMRINKASDDAAGLAVSSTLKTDARIFTQAIRNANDGISTLNIAQGALSSLSTLLTRQQELAEQSANGVYSTQQRQALQKESDALTQEYNRIVATTTFNGLNLLSGDFSSGLRIQVGSGLDGSISFNLAQELLRNQGNGTFTQVQSIAQGNILAGTSALGDLNGDGRADLVRLEYNTAYIAFANADGTFANTLSFGIDAGNSATIVDLNNDGFQDIVIGSFFGPQIRMNNGNGTFQAIRTYPTGYVSGQFSRVGDVNGDGILDIVGTHVTGGAAGIHVRLGNGNGTFNSNISYAVGGAISAAFELADINGDGRADLVSSAQGNNLGIFASLANADGSFGAVYTIAGAGIASETTVTGDFDRDGYIDILTATSSSILISRGNGNGTFKASTTISIAGATLDNAEVGDFNGDGFLDYVATDRGQGRIITAFGNGDGTFKSAISAVGITYTVNPGNFNFRALTLGDINGDGATDIVSVDGNTSGGGNSTLYSLISNTQSVTSVGYLNLTTQASSRASLDTAEVLLTKISNEIGRIGASMSRLDVANRTLQISRENYLSANSRITDADVAQESASLIQQQITQQAASSVLAQANQQPSLALQLLRG